VGIFLITKTLSERTNKKQIQTLSVNKEL
jgi:hypothetical protein